MRLLTIAAAITGLVTLGAASFDGYSDDSLYARDYNDNLYARDYTDDFLYGRDPYEGSDFDFLTARTAEPKHHHQHYHAGGHGPPQRRHLFEAADFDPLVAREAAPRRRYHDQYHGGSKNHY